MYRRRRNSDTWHWWSTCSHWPALVRLLGKVSAKALPIKVSKSKPRSGELCNECQAKERGKKAGR